MHSVTQYVVKVGNKFYSWNRRLERMTLDDIWNAYKYCSYEDAKRDIEDMVEDGRYNGKKKSILKAEVKYEEVEM